MIEHLNIFVKKKLIQKLPHSRIQAGDQTYYCKGYGGALPYPFKKVAEVEKILAPQRS